MQKNVSYNCLEGFLCAFGDLCAVLMSSLKRVMNHDTRLFVLVDHFARQNDDDYTGGELINGTSTTPGVLFPHSSGEKMDLEQYIISFGRSSLLGSFCEKSRALLEAFDAVVEVLLGMQTTLHEISPQLENHTHLVKVCSNFERVFRNTQKLILEPCNLV